MCSSFDVIGTPTSEEPIFREIGVPCHVVQSYNVVQPVPWIRGLGSVRKPGSLETQAALAQTHVLAGLEAALNVKVPLTKKEKNSSGL